MMARLEPNESIGHQMHGLAAELFPLHRSITGPGLRQTLAVLQNYLPLEVHEVPSGTQVFDWQVPQEWHIRDAYIQDADGNRVVDYGASNLHVVAYSQPVQGAFTWRQLRPHLHTLPDAPHWIPYRTAYFCQEWGFCLSHQQYQQLAARGDDQAYEVCIDADFVDGSLTYGEVLLPGEVDDEVLITAHMCHPSLANDNLSGIVVATFLAQHLLNAPRRYTYRFVFAPATIGAITWLARNEEKTHRIRHGLILSVLGDNGPMTYKQTRRRCAEIDRMVQHVLSHSRNSYSVRPFEPLGYDERQFCSPGFDLPTGCLMRTPNGEYPQYHTSADDLNFVRPEALADSLDKCVAICEALDANRVYVNLRPMCEPQLGKHGLYTEFRHGTSPQLLQRATLWVLNLADGRHALLDIAERSGLSLELLAEAAEALVACGLLAEAPQASLSTWDTAADMPRHEFMPR